MAAVLERSYERTVRVMAPLLGLYREMDSVDGLVRFLAEVDSYVSSPTDDSATLIGSLCIGPLSYRLEGSLMIHRVVPPNSLRIRMRAPSLQLELEGTFEFTASAAEETTLRYSATMRSSHPLVRRMRSSLTGALEEHVDSATDLVAVRARQYAEAERRFNDLQQSGHD
ncbi:MAG TPA: hypothetical protein VGH89_03510 [Pseudonocardia sp.]|jgi:hypothetical protein